MKTKLNINWIEQKAMLKLRFAALTDGDFSFEPGEKKEMLERLQYKLGITSEDLHKIIDGIK